MNIPTIQGIIDRRILINYRVDPEVMSTFLPAPFRPKLVAGEAIAGICLIRLKAIRPKGLPAGIGISSENGAHRIAVEWTADGQAHEGVYIPRRDTSSILNSMAGGSIFPGVHHHAAFEVQEGDGQYAVSFKSSDGVEVSIEAQETGEWNPRSVFENLECASCFFEQGPLGYSPNERQAQFDGLELHTYHWDTSPLKVSRVRSSFFEDRSVFPEGSVTFDNALLMRDIDHEWKARKAIRTPIF